MFTSLGNLLNLPFIILFLLLCFKSPRAGIIAIFAVVLGLPISFLYFGFALSSGERYIPNIFIISLFYTAYYFTKAVRERSLDLFDIALIAYLLTGLLITVLVEGDAFNPGPWIKQFAIYPLFFFLGKVFLSKRKEMSKSYAAFRWLLLAIGPYMAIFMLLEFFAKINVHATLLSSFANLVGSQVIDDPIQRMNQHLLANFYRILGPQVEPTETALVAVIAIVAYLSWTVGPSSLTKTVRNVVLVLLAVAVLLSASRTALVMVIPILAASQILRGKLKSWQVAVYLIAATFFFVYIVIDPGGFIDAGLRAFYESSFYSSRLMDDMSVSGRLETWQQALRLIKDDFLFGLGLGTPVYLAGVSRYDAYTVHNSFLDLLLFQGVLVTSFLFTLWGILIAKSVVTLRTLRGKLAGDLAFTLLLLAFVYVILGMFTPDKPQMMYLFWFYGGMLMAAIRVPDSAMGTVPMRHRLVPLKAFGQYPVSQ